MCSRSCGTCIIRQLCGSMISHFGGEGEKGRTAGSVLALHMAHLGSIPYGPLSTMSDR